MTKFKNISSLIYYYFALVSILHFSFAPFMAIYSPITNLVSKLMYFLFFSLFFTLLIVSRFEIKRIQKLLIIFIVMSVYYFLGLKNAEIKGIFGQTINFVFPFFVWILLKSQISINLTHIQKERILGFYLLGAVLNCLYGIFLVYSFDGNLESIYIAKGDYEVFNFIRNGKLRCIGFLQSATLFSNYISVAILIVFYNLRKKKTFFLNVFLFCLFLYSLYLSGSRIPIVVVFLSIIFAFIFKEKPYMIIIASFAFILFSILFLLINKGALDLSAIGRITQYTKGGLLFISNPLGYGIGYAGFPNCVIAFDCSILVILVNFGIFGVIAFIAVYNKILKMKTSLSQVMKGWKTLIIMLVLLSGFVNVIHLGFLMILILLINTSNLSIKNKVYLRY